MLIKMKGYVCVEWGGCGGGGGAGGGILSKREFN